MNKIASGANVAPDAVVEDSVIGHYAVIGARAVVRGATVAPGVIIEPGAVVCPGSYVERDVQKFAKAFRVGHAHITVSEGWLRIQSGPDRATTLPHGERDTHVIALVRRYHGLSLRQMADIQERVEEILKESGARQDNPSPDARE